MKRIYISIGLLFIAMIAMAYFYFSKLDKENTNSNSSLLAASHRSAVVFTIHNDKSVYEILKGQGLLQKLIGIHNLEEISALKKEVFSKAEMSSIFNQQNIYLSFMPEKSNTIDYLISVQFNKEKDQQVFYDFFKKNNIQVQNLQTISKITLSDSVNYYFGLQNNLMLISNSAEQVLSSLKYVRENESNAFMSYIKSDPTLKKNSLANLYLNFNLAPELISSMSKNKKNTLSVFESKNAFASLNYNFSEENLFFNGSTTLSDTLEYLNLFLGIVPQRITIDNILPDNTANYTIYALEKYRPWKQRLNTWLLTQKGPSRLKSLDQIKTQYHIDLDEVMTQYVRNEFVSFQLSTAEKLGAVGLTNGDKMEQQLIEISEAYTENIKILKEPSLLYYFFGAPFKDFKRPYYTIIDNYLIFSNHASTVQDFLNSYKKNSLLTNSSSYSEIFNEISATSNVMYYINKKQSMSLFKNNLLPEYHQALTSVNGLEAFKSFTYQLSSDKSNFQTNMLLNTVTEPLKQTELSPQDSSLNKRDFKKVNN
jgi:hypothetical protein